MEGAADALYLDPGVDIWNGIQDMDFNSQKAFHCVSNVNWKTDDL